MGKLKYFNLKLKCLLVNFDCSEVTWIEAADLPQHLEAPILCDDIWFGKLGEAFKNEEWNAHLTILLLDNLKDFANNEGL